MPYKCEYDDKKACQNCTHYWRDGGICRDCDNTVFMRCPVRRGFSYPEHRMDCYGCLFEPKEREGIDLDGLKKCKCGGTAVVRNIGVAEEARNTANSTGKKVSR